MAQNNNTIFHRFADAINNHDITVLDEIFSPEFVNHNARFGLTNDRQGYKKNIQILLTAFPDAHIEIVDVIVQGDKLVARSILSGTHNGPLMGIMPTKKNVRVEAINIWRIDKGKVAERWEQADTLGLMTQIGAIAS